MKTLLIRKLLHAAGYCLGQPLAWVLRQQNRLADVLAAKGLPHRWIRLALLTLNLFVLTTLLFAIAPMWVVFIVLIIAVIACSGVDFDLPSPKQPEWRNGWDGYGLYNDIGWRLDGSSEYDE
jgi:hypothetical protein